MSFIAKLQRGREVLEQQRRLSVRALGRELGLGGDELEEIVEELVDVQQVARREGVVLQWVGKHAEEVGTGRHATPTLAGARKVVTVVFADLAGSTALHERIDPESARRLMESYYATLQAAVERHGGTVVKLLGDGVMAAFGVPHVAEDDAIRAVRAGVAMQAAFRALVAERGPALGDVGLRVAINTGEVVVSGANDDVVGDPVNVAARLQQEARDGDVVLGEATRRLVDALVTLEPLGSFALRGRAEAVKAHRVVSLEPPARATAAAFVGRDEELGRIGVVYEEAVHTPATRLAVLLGSPGLGKSRLIGEFARRTGEKATVVTARCDAAGGATFAPLADALRELLGVESGAAGDAVRAAIEAALPSDADAGRIAAGIAALLTGSPAAPEETFFVVRRLLSGLAAGKPVVLVIDDLQWAEPLLLDLVEHLVQWGAGVPLLVLIGARPELRDVRSSLGAPGGPVRDVVTLTGLDAGAAMRLAANVIGAADLPAAIAAKVLAASEGNPLFIGALVRMLVEEGALTREGERWTIGTALATLEMPPTIHALLAARIERLAPAECAALERAAVVGRHFSRSAVAALLPEAGAGLDARLELLQRAELIERDTGWFVGEPALRFHHVLIRDAAYRRLLKGTRAELHERLASWLEARVGDAPEHDETIGRHLEEAHRLLGQLGPIDPAGQRLGERAAARLAAAGRRALEGDDVPLAAGLLGRALDRLGSDDPARADLALDWCEALLAAGDVGGAAAAIDELGRLAEESDRLRAWHTCFAAHHTVLTAPRELAATVERVAAAAKSLASLNDDAGEAKGHFVHALALARLGKVGPCEASLDQALAAARRAGDRRRANTVLAIAPLAALWGPSPVTRASGRCLDVVRVLRITQGAPAVEAVALSCQGVLEALRGRTDAARRMIASSREMVEELGIAQRLFEADVFAGFVELLEGDAAAAERTLRGAYDGLRDLGIAIDTARAAALLARALLAQDRIDEARALSHESETLAGDDLKAAIAWRGVRAEALARSGDHAAAIELAKAGVEIAAATDALLDHADARLALAAALRAAGRGAEADTEERRAIDLWEAKGASLLVERARRGTTSATSAVATFAARSAGKSHRRPVRPNFAVEETRRIEEAVAARDLPAIASVYRRDVEIVDHQHGLEYGYDEIVERVRAQIDESTDGAFHHETLATLGDFVGLFQMDATASASVIHGLPIGATLAAYLLVIEADEQGCARRIDIFGGGALGEAIVRLYERHAAVLSEEPARTRAETIVRTLRALQTPFDPDVLAPVVDPGMETVDHRTLGTWNAQGAGAGLEQIRGLRDVASDAAVREEEILGIEANALLVQRMHSGTERVGGGVCERQFLLLTTFGLDGRLNRWEFFDVGDEPKALARFYELAASTRAHSAVSRRVRPNAASASIEGVEAGFAARDLSAIEALLSDPLRTVEHPTGVTYAREGQVESIERMMQLPNLEFRLELLATLGDSLCIGRRCVAASGTAGGRFDVAEFEQDHIVLAEVDEQGRLSHCEVFAADQLCDAIVRLYERYSAQQPEGPVRTRLEVAAQGLATLDGPVELDRISATYDPDLRLADHRVLATWSSESGAELLDHFRRQIDLAPDFAVRINDVLALGPDALLMRMTYFGTGRDSGGVFENRICAIWRFGGDGRFVWIDCYEAEQAADALARFDELAAPSDGPRPTRDVGRRRFRANRASATWDRQIAAINARDAASLQATFSNGLVYIHHVTGRTFGKREITVTWQGAFLAEQLSNERELLATLGDSLVLGRNRTSVVGLAGQHFQDFGPAQLDVLIVAEDKGAGIERAEEFHSDRLGNAVVRLYELYAESLPEGPERTRSEATARTVAPFCGPIDADRVAATTDPASRNVDHRVFGTWTTNSAVDLVRHYRQQLELAPDFAARFEDVLALSPDALLARMSFFGTARDSGGSFENRVLVLFTFGADGYSSGSETFEAEQETMALARFDAVTGAAPARAPLLQIFASRATRVLERMALATARCDWPALSRLFAPIFDFDDRRPLLRLRLSRDGFLEQHRILFDAPNSRWDNTVVATRGERLTLARMLFHGDVDAEGGALEIDHLVVLEADSADDGSDCFVTAVLFAPDDFDAAYAELDARFEAGEAAVFPHVAKALQRSHLIRDRQWQAWAAGLAGEFVYRDHRRLGFGNTVGDADALLRLMKSTVELAPDVRYRDDHIRISAHCILRQTALVGTRDGGAFESPMLLVFEMDAAGRFTRSDSYDVEDVDRALAHFDRLAGQAAVEAFDNGASRTDREFVRRFNTRDWAGIEALAAPELVFDERRRMLHNTCGREVWLEQLRVMFDVPASRFTSELRATRGERLALNLHCFAGEVADGGGPLAMDDHFVLHEIDSDGRIVAIVLFDLEAEDAAHAELDALYEASEAYTPSKNWLSISGFVRAVERRDWGAVRALCRDDFVEQDHRRLAVLGGTEGADAWVANFRSLVDLAPDTAYRAHHVLEAEHGYFVHGSWYGTREGGPYELQVNAVLELDDHGRMRRADMYDDAVTDAALARLAELDRPAAPSRFANAATRAVDRGTAALAARDWGAFAALMAPGFRHYDRQRLAQLESNGEEWLASFRRMVEMTSAPPAYRLLATRGERLALFEMLWHGAAGDVGPSEIDWRLIVEVNDRGEHVAIVVYDPDDLDAAYAELDARYEAEQGDRLPAGWTFVRRWFRAVVDRDWDAVASLCSDDIVQDDHRGLSLTGVTRGVELWIGAIRTLTDLAPDSVFRIHHFIPGARGYYEEGGFYGTREGGPFEIVMNALVEIDDRGLLARVDFYDDDRVFASPRWSELGIPVPPTARESARLVAPGPTFARPNAAMRAVREWFEAYDRAFETGTWDELRRGCHSSLVYEDRRRMALLHGGIDLMMASARERVAMGARPEWRPVGFFGDRVFVASVLWKGGPSDGPFEIEYLLVVECDANGLLTALVLFDLDDASLALREAQRRWAVIEPEMAGFLEVVAAAADRFNGHDPTTAWLADDVVVEDHRRGGCGRIEGADAYAKTLVALWELAPDQRIEMGWHWPAYGPHGGVMLTRRSGSQPDGGAFESEYLQIVLERDGRIARIEAFECEDLERAVARFAEVAAGASPDSSSAGLRRRGPPAGIGKPNAASLWLHRFRLAFNARDWGALHGLYAPEGTYEDRQRLSLVSGGLDTGLSSLRARAEAGFLLERIELLGTAGRRVAIQRLLWAGGGDTDRTEVEHIVVQEVDDAGRLCASINFDPDDARAAQREAWARWEAIEPDAAAVAVPMGELVDAFNAHDRGRWRAQLADEIVVEDHRHAGMGRIEGPAAYADSLVALWALAPDTTVEAGWYWPALDRHGAITLVRRTGRIPEGGDFESEYLNLYTVSGARITRIELYEVEQLDAALARFEELRPMTSSFRRKTGRYT